MLLMFVSIPARHRRVRAKTPMASAGLRGENAARNTTTLSNHAHPS
jgi:hypothetical protein